MSNMQNGAKKGGSLWLVFVAVLVVLLLVIGGIAIYKNTNNPTETPDTGSSQESQSSEDNQSETTSSETESETQSEVESETVTETQTEEPDVSDGIETFVMFGVDSRSDKLGKGTRSDSIMLISVNHDKGEVKVVSIYRDCMLYQSYDGTTKGYKKISNAHSYFGPEGALAVLNENFDMNIEKFVTVNFGTLTELVDKIGGVDIELTEAEINIINRDNEEQLSGAGVHRLNGSQALTFSRIRKIGNDYARTERQREVLFEIFETSKTMSAMERIELAESMLDEVNTNYKEDEAVSLLYYMSKYEIVTMTAYPQVFYGGSVDGSWVEVPCTLIDMNTELHKILYNNTNYAPSERVQEISATLRNKVSGPNIDQRD